MYNKLEILNNIAWYTFFLMAYITKYFTMNNVYSLKSPSYDRFFWETYDGLLIDQIVCQKTADRKPAKEIFSIFRAVRDRWAGIWTTTSHLRWQHTVYWCYYGICKGPDNISCIKCLQRYRIALQQALSDLDSWWLLSCPKLRSSKYLIFIHNHTNRVSW